MQAGCDIVCAIENNPTALAVYEQNFPNHGVVCMDIGDVHTVVQHVRPLQPQLILASPPCQSHSLSTEKGDNTDARACLTERAAEIISEVRPRYFVVENVPGLLRSAVWRRCERLLSKHYTLHASVLNFAQLGVPQRRKRAIVVGCLDAGPVARYTEAVDALRGTREMAIRDVFKCDHYFHNARCYHIAWVRPASTPFPTVRTAIWSPKHPESYKNAKVREGSLPLGDPGIRYFSVEDHAIIQGLGEHTWPDLTKTQKAKCIGNAVPPPAMRWIVSTLTR